MKFKSLERAISTILRILLCFDLVAQYISDQKNAFFSSDRRGGEGSFDVYVTKIQVGKYNYGYC